MIVKVLIVSGLFAAVSFAQSNLGSISGVVSDAQGAVMPAAKAFNPAIISGSMPMSS